MRLKKANAALGLLSIAVLLAHAGYQVVAYLIFLYNPAVTSVLAWATAAVVAAHAVLGMSIVMFAHDGSTLGRYPSLNRRTLLQRASAIGIIVMLVLHVQAFDILRSGTLGLVCAEAIQVLFFACVFTHVATSLGNALVTLGLLRSMDAKRKLDRIVWVACALLWAICTLVIGGTYPALAAMP